MQILDPRSKKAIIYFESKLPGQSDKKIGLSPKIKSTALPEYELIPADNTTIGNYWHLRTENKKGRSKYLTIINDFLTRSYPIFEVKIPLKSAGAIAHTLNSVIMHHRIRNVAATCLRGRAVLFLLDP